MMKKLFSFSIILSLIIVLAGCGNSSSGAAQKQTNLLVGASAVPHAEILKKAVPLLKKKGINLKVKVFNDYVLPNKALAAKQLDPIIFSIFPISIFTISNTGPISSMPEKSTSNRSASIRKNIKASARLKRCDRSD